MLKCEQKAMSHDTWSEIDDIQLRDMVSGLPKHLYQYRSLKGERREWTKSFPITMCESFTVILHSTHMNQTMASVIKEGLLIKADSISQNWIFSDKLDN